VKENVYALGSKDPVGRVNGRNELTPVTITMLKSEVGRLQNQAPDRDITKIPPADIVVTYISQSRAVTDTLKFFAFTSNVSTSNIDDAMTTVELEGICSKVRHGLQTN